MYVCMSTYVFIHPYIKRMAELRTHARSRFDAICPGEDIEREFHRIIQGRVTSGKDVAFYPFRRLYKRHLQSFLSNYAQNETFRDRVTGNRDELLFALRAPDSRHYTADTDDILPQDEEEEGEGELREGQFSCSNCARKGKYARNTSHIELQTRSADESTSVYVNCFGCGRTYRISS